MMLRKMFSVYVLSVTLLSGCIKTPPTSPPETPIPIATAIPGTSTPAPAATATIPPTSVVKVENPDWWKKAIFYEIFVRSFYDSNGDGIGDFDGITQKLDYLNDGDPDTSDDLGVTALWLMPVMPSPSEHGYDVTDYYAVNPQYGTMEDFKELLEQVHKRGMHLILDFPQNHSSSEHPWFVASQDPASSYRNWYVWSDNDPGFLGPWNRVVWHPLNNDYFYGYFWEGMPDLNYTNPEVTSEIYEVTRFWLEDIGVDGFRLDAIGALIEEGQMVVETRATHQWFQDYYNYYKGINPSAFAVGEVWNPNEIVVPYVENKEVDLAFNFDLSFAILRAINETNPAVVALEVIKARDMFPEGRYGVFVTNHDMDRIMTQLGNDVRKAKVAAAIYLTLPGVPFIYYGEEVGMGGELHADQIRLPMQWSAEANAGFSSAIPWIQPQADFVTFNATSEQGKTLSILEFYKQLIQLRNSFPVIQQGKVYFNTSTAPELYSTTLVLENEAVLTLINLSDHAVTGYRISQPDIPLPAGTYTITSLYGTLDANVLEINIKNGFREFRPATQIPAYGSVIIHLK